MSASGDDSDAFFALYRYTPSLEAAALTGTLFSILSIAHIAKLWTTRSFYFIPFAIGGVFEAVGYYGRIWSHFDKNAIGGFVVQSLLILVAPALFAASVYMILGRTIRALHAEHHSIIRIQWLTKLFVIGDVVSFFAQGGGGGIQAAGTLELYELGEKIILVGLFVQIVMFGIFIVCAVVFHRRIVLRPTTESREGTIQWKSHMWALYCVSCLVMVRSAFRVVEYAQGNAGYLVRREYFLYLFDAALMLVTMGTFLVQYVDDLNPASQSAIPHMNKTHVPFNIRNWCSQAGSLIIPVRQVGQSQDFEVAQIQDSVHSRGPSPPPHHPPPSCMLGPLDAVPHRGSIRAPAATGFIMRRNEQNYTTRPVDAWKTWPDIPSSLRSTGDSIHCELTGTDTTMADAPQRRASTGAAVGDEAKRARKRATDRKSQQNHRRRQKAYVKQLEDSMRAFERQCAANPDGRAAALVEAHKKLEQRFEKAASLLERVRGILNDNSEDYSLPGAFATGTEDDDNQPCRHWADGLDGLDCLDSHDNHDNGTTSSMHPSNSTASITHIDTQPLSTSPEVQINTETYSSTVLDLLSCGLDMPDSSEALALEPSTETTQGSGEDDSQIDPSFCFGAINVPVHYPETLLSGDKGFELCQASDVAVASAVDPASAVNVPSTSSVLTKSIISIDWNRWPALALYAYGPRHSPPEGTGAKVLENMVLEAKAEHASGRFSQAKPSLRRLLTDGPGDVLAFRLFHYLSCYGEMPLHLFLGIFWVQYLVLRSQWQVLNTEEDYTRIPQFMRPDSIERQIPHSIVIDLFVW
ncbi:hypothetical protein JX266_010410 [Neoarthrinium moseri]|nr:hypothetical protein JX266_010410 [Neoarthrinium moseri]